MDSIIHQLKNETLTCLHVSNLDHSSSSSSCSHVISLRSNSMAFPLKVLWCFFVTHTPCRAEGPPRCLLLLGLLVSSPAPPCTSLHAAAHWPPCTSHPGHPISCLQTLLGIPFSSWSLFVCLFVFIGSSLAKLLLEIWKNRYTNYAKLWTLSQRNGKELHITHSMARHKIPLKNL